MDSNLKDALKEIIKDTFKTIDTIYNNRYEKITDNNGSRLIFPCYSSQNKTNQNPVRVSEQELRFIFIETFCKSCHKRKIRMLLKLQDPNVQLLMEN